MLVNAEFFRLHLFSVSQWTRRCDETRGAGADAAGDGERSARAAAAGRRAAHQRHT